MLKIASLGKVIFPLSAVAQSTFEKDIAAFVNTMWTSFRNDYAPDVSYQQAARYFLYALSTPTFSTTASLSPTWDAPTISSSETTIPTTLFKQVHALHPFEKAISDQLNAHWASYLETIASFDLPPLAIYKGFLDYITIQHVTSSEATYRTMPRIYDDAFKAISNTKAFFVGPEEDAFRLVPECTTITSFVPPRNRPDEACREAYLYRRVPTVGHLAPTTFFDLTQNDILPDMKRKFEELSPGKTEIFEWTVPQHSETQQLYSKDFVAIVVKSGSVTIHTEMGRFKGACTPGEVVLIPPSIAFSLSSNGDAEVSFIFASELKAEGKLHGEVPLPFADPKGTKATHVQIQRHPLTQFPVVGESKNQATLFDVEFVQSVRGAHPIKYHLETLTLIGPDKQEITISDGTITASHISEPVTPYTPPEGFSLHMSDTKLAINQAVDSAFQTDHTYDPELCTLDHKEVLLTTPDREEFQVLIGPKKCSYIAETSMILLLKEGQDIQVGSFDEAGHAHPISLKTTGHEKVVFIPKGQKFYVFSSGETPASILGYMVNSDLCFNPINTGGSVGQYSDQHKQYPATLSFPTDSFEAKTLSSAMPWPIFKQGDAAHTEQNMFVFDLAYLNAISFDHDHPAPSRWSMFLSEDGYSFDLAFIKGGQPLNNDGITAHYPFAHRIGGAAAKEETGYAVSGLSFNGKTGGQTLVHRGPHGPKPVIVEAQAIKDISDIPETKAVRMPTMLYALVEGPQSQPMWINPKYLDTQGAYDSYGQPYLNFA